MRAIVNSFTVTGTAVLILTALVAAYLRRIPFAPLRAGLGPAFFPTVTVTMLGVLGVASLVTGIACSRRQTSVNDVEPVTPRSFVTVLLVILYAVGIRHAGFLIPTGAFLFVSMVALGVPVRRAVLITVLTSTAIYVVFGLMFRMRLF